LKGFAADKKDEIAIKLNVGSASQYSPLRGGFFNREYPASWRDIDKGIKELEETAEERR
jgi:hypothetical protein